jgi:phage-related protein (TIGR01555 family)
MLRKFWTWLMGTTAPVTISPPAAAKRSALAIADDAHVGPEHDATFVSEPFKRYTPAPGVLPTGTALAQDNAMSLATAWAQGGTGTIHEGLGFMGYPYLAELSQRPEYRAIVETIAKEMTRKFIKITASGQTDKSRKVDKLTRALKQYNIQGLFRELAELDGFFGRAHLYIDTGYTEDAAELKTPLILDPRKIPRRGDGSLQGFKVVEPIWVYPSTYNSDNPLAPDFCRPRGWYVMGREIHRDRLLTFVSREVPDILKPAYAFGGLSLSQMVKPYVDRWIRTVRSVSDMVHAFSKTILKTNMASVLQGGPAAPLLSRVKMFTQYRDNRAVSVIDKDSEEIQDVSTPLGTLDKLQAQSQEHLASISGIPLVVLLGVTPSGLNASSDGEIKVFYARVKSFQEDLFNAPLEVVLALLQLKIFGSIDPDIGFEYPPLWEESAKEKADTDKVKADTDVAYIDAGVVAPEEVRTSLASDDSSRYHGLSGPAPEPPEQEDPQDDGQPQDDLADAA